MTRKDFLNRTARLFIIGGFAGGTVYLGTRGRILATGECSESTQCSHCGDYTACNLPQAIKQRDYEK